MGRRRGGKTPGFPRFRGQFRSAANQCDDEFLVAVSKLRRSAKDIEEKERDETLPGGVFRDYQLPVRAPKGAESRTKRGRGTTTGGVRRGV